MAKKIVICLNTSWNIYNFRLNLARALTKAGYRIIFLAPYDRYSDILKEEFEYYHIYMNNKSINPLEDIKTLIEFYKLYKIIKPDLVLNYTIKPNIYGNIICSILGIKTINNISGLGTVFIKETFVTKIVKLLYKLSLLKSSKVFFQNNDDRDLFLSNKLVRKDQIDILPGSGIDTSKFLPNKFEKKDNTFRFLLIGRMLWDKGVGEYVEAAKIIKEKYPDTEFQLLGSLNAINKTAITEQQMKNWTKDGFVKYMGVTDDVKKFINKVDCIVLPSYREGVPRTLLESASMSKPIITTNTIGCKEVIEDGLNGYLCNVKSSKDLAVKMKMMINLSKDERKRMGEYGRVKMIKEFDENIVITKYIKTIDKLL